MSIAPGDQQVGWHLAVPQRFPVGLLHCSHRHKAPHHRIGSMCVFCLRIRYLSCKVWYGPKNEGIKWKMLQLCQVYPEKHVKKKQTESNNMQQPCDSKKIKQTPVHGLSMCNLGRGVQRKCSSNPHLSLIGPAVQIDCLLLGTVGLDAK